MNMHRKKQFADSFMNKLPVEVLFEEKAEGYTREYVRVQCRTEAAREGNIIKGYITGRINDDIMEFTPEKTEKNRKRL